MEMTYGYCRISTGKQNIDRQERNILNYDKSAVIVREVYTGTTQHRPKWQSLLCKIRKGDTIIFDSVSRMSRNAEEGVATYLALFDKGVNLVFLKEPHINTETYRHALQNGVESVGNEIADIYISATNKVLKLLARRQIELAFEQSEKEVTDLRQRTREGIETARRNGKQIGQQKGRKLTVKKKAPAMQKILECSKDFNGILSDPDVIRLTGLSRKTYYKYKQELRNEGV